MCAYVYKYVSIDHVSGGRRTRRPTHSVFSLVCYVYMCVFDCATMFGFPGNVRRAAATLPAIDLHAIYHYYFNATN